MKRKMRTEADSSHWCPVKEQEAIAQTEIQEISEIAEILEQAAHGCCGISILVDFKILFKT